MEREVAPVKGLSQCMIVKNEEKNIRNALSWGRGIADEQIVVDTGSSDRTMEIAREMGAKVYSFPWTEDFSAAKNFAIRKARGRWIAFLDADEYFGEEDVKKIPELLKTLPPGQTDGLMVSMIQLDGQGNASAGGTQVRLFPNRGDLRYRRRIHEQLAREDGKTLQLVDATEILTVFHTGYADIGDLQKKKYERNIRLIQRELEDHPDDHEMLGYLGDVYYGAEQWEQAEEAYEKAIAAMPRQLVSGDQRSAVTFLNLIRIRDQKDLPEEQVVTLYEQATAREDLGKDADFEYFLAWWYLRRDRRLEALPYLTRAVEKLERYGTFGRALYAAAALQQIYEQTAVCQRAAGNLPEAIRQATAVLQADPWSMTALCVLLESFHMGGVSASQADQFLDRIYVKNSLKAKVFLMRSVKKAEWAELEALFRKRMSPEELACFDRSVEKGN